MQMYNETRRKTSSVRLFLQRKEINGDGFWEGMYYKKEGYLSQTPNLY